jgi:hypothetical protein
LFLVYPHWSSSSFSLGFQHHRSRALRASQRPPPLARVAFHNLTFFRLPRRYRVLGRHPVSNQNTHPQQSDFRFLNQLVFDTPLFGHFISHGNIHDNLSSTRRSFQLGCRGHTPETRGDGQQRQGSPTVGNHLQTVALVFQLLCRSGTHSYLPSQPSNGSIVTAPDVSRAAPPS